LSKKRLLVVDPNADHGTKRKAVLRLIRARAARNLEVFTRAYPPAMNYIFGNHTLNMIHTLQKVSEDVQRGISRFVCLCIPFRHGKSDIASRTWPVWHLGNNPEHEFMQVSYNHDLSSGFSRFVRGRFRQTGNLWGLDIDPENNQIDSWRIADHAGAYHATSFGGTVAGRGAHVLGLDDYFKDRETAESRHMREKTWESFTNDFMTRRAPVSATVITANRWHEDDVVGRIIQLNDPASPKYDPRFPKFEILRYPAQNEDGSWLFSERFSDQWYESMQTTLGTYAWGAMGQQDPKPRHGKLLRTDMVQVVDPSEWIRMPLVQKARWNRGWDLASTQKEIARDDPDASVGTRAAVVDDENGNQCILVDDVIHGHWRGDKRNQIIVASSTRDGASTGVIIETVAGYTDAYDIVSNAIAGAAIVKKFVPKNDKVARSAYIEPIFEAGRVFIKQAEWNDAWLDELTRFPEGTHDDRYDSLIAAVHEALARKGQMFFSF